LSPLRCSFEWSWRAALGANGTSELREAGMDDHVYRVIQIVGSSEKSIDDAIRMAVARASKTLRELRWFEVVETRGHIDNGNVEHFQVTLKVGFTLEGD
jgi:dodecin